LNAGVTEDRALRFRIGVHVGDVMVRGGDLLGDGVNIAARVQSLAEPGRVMVSDDAHRQIDGKIDPSFEYRGEQQVRNIARPVRVYALAGAAPSRSEPRTLPLPDKPSIAVLPFTNMSGDPEQEYFADGIVEDVITSLSRFKGLFVIARNSSFTYKGRASDAQQVGKDLGVRYVLEGSVRRGSAQLRVSSQLIEAETGRHVWADRFDGNSDQVFDLQDQIAERVIGSIAPALLEAEGERLRPRPTENLTAYELYLRAVSLLPRLARSAYEEAMLLLDRALDQDPKFGLALAAAAECRFQRLMQGWTDDPNRELADGIRLANRGLEVGSDDAEVLGRIGFALANFEGELDRSFAILKRAVELNPNSAQAWYGYGWVQIYLGAYEQARPAFERARRLNPRDMSVVSATNGLCACSLYLERFEEAIALGYESVSQNPGVSTTWRILAAALAQAGRQSEANAAIKELLRRDPRSSLRNIRGGVLKTPKLHLYLEGLRLAGLPE
jgi:adenylate cyclase